MNYQIVLTITGNPELVKNQISNLEGVETKEFTRMEINYISIVQEVSLDYLTQELPDNFFDLLYSEQISFIKNHLAEIYEEYTGDYIKEQILDYSRGKAFSYEKKGFLIKDKLVA